MNRPPSMDLPAKADYPLLFSPLLQSKIWGGDGLWRFLRKGPESQTDLGESWELSDQEPELSVVRNGPLAGRTLRDLVLAQGREILGRDGGDADAAAPGISASFPLLYKFIYARDKLSVQVHPGEGSPLGKAKTECWHIVHAPEGAGIIVGLSKAAPREAVLAALQSKDCATVLNRIPIRSGDTLFIPAGTVHAITEGLLIYEVQQSSDTTFRLYDWDRLDDKGRPRALHLKESAQVIDYVVHDLHRIEPLRIERPSHREEFLTACPFFLLKKIHRMKDTVSLEIPGRFRVATCLRGSVRIERAEEGGTGRAPGSRSDAGVPGEAVTGVRLLQGETALLPASLGKAFLRAENPEAEILLSMEPDLEGEVVAPLREAGYSAAEIDALGGYYGIRARR